MQQHIVAVGIRHDVAINSREPAIDRAGLAAARLAAPAELVAVGLQNIDRVFRGSRVFQEIG